MWKASFQEHVAIRGMIQGMKNRRIGVQEAGIRARNRGTDP